MKKLMRICSIALIASVVFAACSVEKRHYMPGYHIEWKTKTKTTSTAYADETKTVRHQGVQTTTVDKQDMAVAQTMSNEEQATPPTNQAVVTSTAPSTKTFSLSTQSYTVTKTTTKASARTIIKKAERLLAKRKPNQ